jgi:hypothetical protein
MNNVPVRRDSEWEIEEIQLCNGVNIQYPKWFLYAQKAELRTVYGKTFLQLSSNEIRQTFRKAWVMPLELCNLFAGIQSLESLAILND